MVIENILDMNLPNEVEGVTQDDVALYDRQIRLWGMEAQAKLQKSHILIIGMTGCAAEIAKNIVLAGINSLTIGDYEVVTKEDSCSNFLIDHSKSLGINRATACVERLQILNPRVNIQSIEIAELYKPAVDCDFDVIIDATGCVRHSLRLNEFCRDRGDIAFFVACVFGYHGYMFSDLGEHEFIEETITHVKNEENKKYEDVVTKKMQNVKYSSFKSVVDSDWTNAKKNKVHRNSMDIFLKIQACMRFITDFNRRLDTDNEEADRKELMNICKSLSEHFHIPLVDDSFVSYSFAELSPVSAIVGGVIAQEVIKAITKKDRPHNNQFFFDGLIGTGIVDCI